MSIPRIPRHERDRLLAERGLAAKRIIEDDVVIAWFSARKESLTEKMIQAPISDDQTRREAALEINVIDGLWRQLEHEAGQGMSAIQAIEKRKA